MSEVKSIDILKSIRQHFGNYDYKLFNSYMYEWECDFWALSTSKYAIEVEVKVSRSDFFADFKKLDKHKLFINHKKQHVCFNRRWGGSTTVADTETKQFFRSEFSNIHFKEPSKNLPNKFYYACPDGLLKINEIPSYAGLFYYVPGRITEIKKAPFLHKEKTDKTTILLSKYYNRSINMNNRLYMLRDSINHHLDEEGKNIFSDFINKLHFE